MHEHIVLLKKHFKTHKAAADFLGVSHSRYYQWVADPDGLPLSSRRSLELAVENLGLIKDTTQ